LLAFFSGLFFLSEGFFFKKNIFFEQEIGLRLFLQTFVPTGVVLCEFLLFFSRSLTGCGKTIWQSICVFKTSPVAGKLDETIIAARLERNLPRCRNTTFVHLSGGRHVGAVGARRP
jgi:hypothetical protein